LTRVVEPTAAPTEDFTVETQVAEETAQAAIESAQATEQAATLKAKQATSVAVDASVTAEAAAILTETASVNAEATAQAQGMASIVKQLASEGLLENTAGTYSKLDDFNETWAQIGWYQWWNTGLAPTDFVIAPIPSGNRPVRRPTGSILAAALSSTRKMPITIIWSSWPWMPMFILKGTSMGFIKNLAKDTWERSIT
jgi:hypothetical protein